MIFKDKREKISNHFNSQEGQSYPCSNQIVCCGVVTANENKWNDFVKENMNNTVMRHKDYVVLKNGELWYRIPPTYSIRGYRYYKIKVDTNINEDFLDQIILPCCEHYCCSFEWF